MLGNILQRPFSLRKTHPIPPNAWINLWLEQIGPLFNLGYTEGGWTFLKKQIGSYTKKQLFVFTSRSVLAENVPATAQGCDFTKK